MNEVEKPEVEWVDANVVTVRGGSGIITPEDFRGYWDVIMDAFAIHIHKERIRRALWKEYPAKDQFNQIKIKADRIMRTLEIIDRCEDPALITALKAEIESEGHDIINYVTFGARQL